MIEDPKDWIAISLLQGIGPATLLRLYESDWALPRLIDEFPLSPLKKHPTAQQELRAYRAGHGALWDKVQQALAYFADASIHCILANDQQYPPLLKAAPDRPVMLFVQGNLDALHMPILSIVGSRNASTAGLRHAYQFSQALASYGLVITSGLANGIDGAAHQAVVDINKPTIAVMGTGSDRIYPSRHRRLAEQILETGGALVTDLLPGNGPLAHHFPRRNRIISGLATGVLVVEAAIKSGSLITARNALEQGREVFAIPGAIDHPGSKGCHALIREGAVLVECAEDILNELPALFGSVAESPNQATAPDVAALTADQVKLLQAIEYSVTFFEDIQHHSGLIDQSIASMLVELEMLGWIESVSGGFQRIR